MVKWVNCNPSSLQKQAYNALEKAAERIGHNNYCQQFKDHIKKGRSKKTFRFTVTEEHKKIIDAMPKVLSGEILPEEAMAMLHEYDVKMQRLGLKEEIK
jgi:precorrin-3B methylase